MSKNKYDIPVAKYPEAVGIKSSEIQELLYDFKSEHVEIHSMILIRHGKIACETYASPFGKDVPHAMYSVSKSFTSAAVGLAIDEGFFTLDSKVIDFFPEYRPAKPDEKLEKMTVYHLLTMTAGKNVSLLNNKTHKDWIKDFFAAPWYAEPGKEWKYISENVYICCAIIKRVTGLGVVDFLIPRLFKPLGIERRPQWEHDINGLEAGGWGLFVTPEELAKFTLCMQQNGKYAGKQVLPEWFVEQASQPLVDNSVNKEVDSKNGYGFLFWRNALKNCYRLDGMFSQFGIVFEDYDAVAVFTASEINEQKTRDCIFRHFPQAFIEESEKPEEEYKLTLDPMPVLEKKPRSVMEHFVKGRLIHFYKNPVLNAIGFPPSMIPPAAVYMSNERSGNIDNVVLDFSEDECVMVWDEGKDHNVIHCGMDGNPRIGKIHLANVDFTVVSYATWANDSALEIWMRPLEAVNERRIRLEFRENRVVLYPETMPTSESIISGLADGLNIPVEIVTKSVKSVAGRSGIILDAPLVGKIM